MDYIKKISEMYNGNILLCPPYLEKISKNIPQEICSILHVSNGIHETMIIPQSSQTTVIGWIIYPYDMIMSDTLFYKTTYKTEGIFFATDGAGNPFIMKANGTIFGFNRIDNEETKLANSLSVFWTRG